LIARILLAGSLLAFLCTSALADIVRTLGFKPGSPLETSLLLSGSGSSVDGEFRRAEAGGFWTYRIVVTPSARVALRFEADGEPVVNVSGSDGKPLISRMDRAGALRTVYFTAPANQPLGGGIRVQFAAKAGAIGAKDLVAEVRQPDANGDGIPDAVATMMGVATGRRADVIPRPSRPQTSFQSGGPYDPSIGIPTDAVLAYTSDPLQIRSWADAGYTVQTMGGFRDGKAYLDQHPDEVQRDRSGNPIAIGGDSFYMVPTQARIDLAKQYYAAALAAGSTAVCPEEPEFSASAGYEDSFKKEWQARYGTPWEPPHSSIDARYKSEQLKGQMERRNIEEILNDAQRIKPAATRMVAVHSPVTYYQWGYPVPHYGLLTIPALQEIIGQVWTGTARSQARSAGVRSERTFEVGYLEYSSLYNLVRGSGKRLWFLMDPVEDNPDRTMDDYLSNYLQTLTGSLMFPQVDSFEVMPWPQRIYSRVPPGYATTVNSIVGALAEMWRFPNGQVEAGSLGIGVFVSDSMAWQRGDPAPSDYDGFYGLCLPLVLHGVPVQVLSLDRLRDAGYLSRVKTLLVSYDYLKPESPDLNRVLADWTRRGGSLVIFGGTDAYDNVADSWWRKAGLASPLDDLFNQLSVKTTRESGAANAESNGANLSTILAGDGSFHDLRNRHTITLDLTPYARETGSVQVRFEDVTPSDGWGAWLGSAELRIGGKLAASFRTGSDLETRFLAEDRGSQYNGAGRFVDRGGYWVYRFDNLPKSVQIQLTLDIGNGYLIKAGPAGPRAPVLETADKSFGPTVTRLRLPPNFTTTRYSLPDGGRPLYKLSTDSKPLLWETKAGDGNVAFVGISPSYLTATAQTSRWLRALTKHAYESTGSKYQEQSYFVSRRGPYAAVRTLGKEYTLDGMWVNLLSPTLAVVEDPEVPARSSGFFMAAGPDRGGPRVMAVSGRLRAKYENGVVTGFLVQAPAKTEGVARLWAGKRRAVGAKAHNSWGEPVTVRLFPDGDTLLVRYANEADGVVVKVAWQ
jgi:hypothetical protein